MKFWSVEPAGLLEETEGLSPLRELYQSNQVPVELKCEAAMDDAKTIFNELPVNILPKLPPGYQWTSYNDEYSIIRNFSSKEHSLKLILFGPNDKDQINFLFQVDGITTYSLAHTSRKAEPARSHPMAKTAYNVPGFDYSKTKYNNHVQGHLIDQKDTMQVGPREKWSCYDPRNFVPEPPEYEWGPGIRNQKVAALRRMNVDTAYAQHLHYLEKPLETIDKTRVPVSTHFTTYTINGKIYNPTEMIDINWNENMKRPAGEKIVDHASRVLTSSIDSAPVIEVYSPITPDRTLRLNSRNHKKKADSIESGSTKSRFPLRSSLFSRTLSGDVEFEHSDRKIEAAIAADKTKSPSVSLQYTKSSIKYSEELIEHDVAPLQDKKNAKKSLDFLKEKQSDTEWQGTDIDVEGLTDQFRSLFN